MGLSEKIMEALRAGILLNEKISTLIDKVDRMDRDMRSLNDRLIRLETMVEIAQHRRTKGEGSPRIEL